MGEESKIEWTDETFNPWRGCTKISPGCEHCYASALAKRNPAVLGVWGDAGTRVIASEEMWKQPLKWAEKWRKASRRGRVFCASLADWLEDRADLVKPRQRLLSLIRDTGDALEWLLLTKRPENCKMLVYPGTMDVLKSARARLGVSVESQDYVGRIAELLKWWDGTNFVSAEPLLGPVDLIPRCTKCGYTAYDAAYHMDHQLCFKRGGLMEIPRLDWIITGGESGPGARPMHPDWARSIRDQCRAAGVAYFHKQNGEFIEAAQIPQVRARTVLGTPSGYMQLAYEVKDSQYVQPDGFPLMARVGKKAAGAMLDGRQWREFPR